MRERSRTIDEQLHEALDLDELEPSDTEDDDETAKIRHNSASKNSATTTSRDQPNDANTVNAASNATTSASAVVKPASRALLGNMMAHASEPDPQAEVVRALEQMLNRERLKNRRLRLQLHKCACRGLCFARAH